jgi:hypothetical protein
MRYIILLFALVSFSFAQPLSLGKPNEEKEHSPWLNMGFGIGVLSPITDEYKEQGKAFVNPSILFGIQFAALSAVTFELDWAAKSPGVWFGFEQQFMQTNITPFAEAQIGARAPDKNLGLATSINGGVIFFRESQFRIRLKGGYEGIFNKNNDASWNAEVGVLFALGRPGLETIKVD